MLFLTKGQAAPHAITALVALSILIYFTVVQKRASTGDLAQENDALPARTLAKLSIPFVRSHQIASLGRHGRRGSDKHAGVRDARVNDRDATRTSSSTLPDILRHLVGPPTLADRNDTAGRSFLSKRADLNFDEYVCKGESGLVKMRAARPDPPQFRFRDLQRNGWVIDIGQPPTTIGIDVEQALFELDIPWGTNSYVNFIARLKNRFVNIHGESKVSIEIQYPSRLILHVKAYLRYITTIHLGRDDGVHGITADPGVLYNFAALFANNMAAL